MKIYLEVYGCTANKSDASIIRGVLKEDHHELVADLSEADVIILLTCTVIDTTEQRMLSRLREFNKTGKKIVVAGCMAAVQPDLVKSIIPGAKLLSPRYSHHILDVLFDKKTLFEDKMLVSKYFDDVIAPISIAEGCMFSCSYCITSPARGELTSYPVDEIVQDVCSALKQGCREIQLTAQDTASYGMDINSNLGLLLSDICKVDGEYKIRVGMMNPYTALKSLDPILQSFDDSKIYKFLHLPVQSGDDDVLKKMGRKYNVDDFLEIIKKFRGRYPESTISTDVIVGFPTETEQQFQHTIDLLNKVKPDVINITKYSARPFTKAKNMEGRIKTEIVKERSKLLTKICGAISLENNLEHIGKKYTVLVTEQGKNNTFVGRAENYKPVVVEEKVAIGDFLPVEVVEAGSTYLVGKLI